jgi:recombination associated protein RdgC
MPEAARKSNELKTVADDRAFLGEEFLTWLWWRVESGDAEFELPAAAGQPARRVGVAIEPPLLLRSPQEDPEGNRPEQLLRFGRPLRSAESAAALQSGKRLVRARLLVAGGGQEWSLTFDAAEFCIKSARVPEPDATEDSGDRALECASGFSELSALLDGLLRLFLGQRLSPGFRERDWAQMKAWAGRGAR